MDDLLHDEIDAIEDLREEAEQAVEKVRAELVAMAQEAESFEELLQAANVRVADAVAELTTRAAKSGFEFAEKKLEKAGRLA